MSTDIAPLLADQGAADLAPLRRSHEADQLETELKALFMAMFDQYVRPGLDAVATVGAPHLGGIDQLERAVKVDGIALQRSEDQGAMRYLHKAFRARNPKRGLHMLRAYLQVLFGSDGWDMSQLWQDDSFTYPTALFDGDGYNRYLTSRVHVRVLSTGIAASPDLMAQAFRSVLPARMVLSVSLMSYPFYQGAAIYIGATASTLRGKYIGEFSDPPFRLSSGVSGAIHQAALASLERQKFTGTFQ